MSQPTLFSQTQNSDFHHRNHFLFSDYYLNELLFSSATWKGQTAAALAFFEELKGLYSAEKANLPTYNENQLETHWIQPILDKMGWGGAYETQASIPNLTNKGIRKPDYVFFPNETARKAAAQSQNTTTYANKAVAVGEMKRWGVALNKKQGGRPTFENNNPSYQIDYYLRATDVRWGILTDGRYWRLVNKESSYKLDVYFEIDLQAVLEDDSKNGLLYFWLFFRHGAFVPDAQGNIFVDDALTASLNYAREVENDLRDNAYKALEQLIQGFFAFGRNGLSAENPADLETVYTNALYLLYRLLFLLYGESRGLLPLNNPRYNAVSLTTLINDVSDKLNNDGYQFSPYSFQYWARQQHSTHIINGTDPAANDYYGVPRYNGGLFSPTAHPFLEKYKMGDAYLLRAIDYLARRDRHKQGQHAIKERVDYRTLDVRQLGSIYEGLLEYRPARATQPMVTIRRKGSEVWIPASEKGKKPPLETRDVGDLYLATDKGERKATGSYYTPDYIVRYIVGQTLQPLLDEIQTDVQTLPEAERGAAFVTRVLALNVLDPAMGSGHFLVAAAEYLALALTNDDYTKPPTGSLSVAQGEISELERQAQEKNYWMRRVTEACIYGVDKNGMAVELAKLSLWLKTVSADKPLSFLDHHLRHGDSLVGARLSDLAALPQGSGRQAVRPSEGQQMLIDESQLTTDLNLAVGGMMAIERATSDSLDDIHLKEKLFDDMRDHVAKWRTLANIWVSSYFGNAMSPQEYGDVARQLQGKQTTATPAQLQPFIDHPAVQQNDYFHWELEFPEVFFDEYGRALKDNSGFDAIIGNPPYVRQELLQEIRDFLQQRFECFHGSADLYTYFLETGIYLLKKQHLLSVITSHKFMRADYGERLRNFILAHTQIHEIVHFGDLPVFADASAYPAIISLEKDATPKPMAKALVTKVQNLDFEDLQQLVAERGYYLSRYGLQSSGWTLQNGSITYLQDKIAGMTISLASYLDDKIQYGIKTGFNAAFFIDAETRRQLIQADPNSESLIKPLIVGEDVRRYHLNFQERYLIFTRRGIDIKQFPAVLNYLAQFQDQLEPKPENWKGMWEGRKKGNYLWYELQDAVDYYEAFEQPKIVYPVISKAPRFTIDDEGLYPNDKCFIIPQADFYLLAILNSSLSSFLVQLLLSGLRGDYLEFRATHLKHLPIIPRANESSNGEMDEELLKQPSSSIIAQMQKASREQIQQTLASLARQMILLGKKRRRITQRFVLDLEGVTDETTLEKLFQKGKWEESLHKKVTASRPFVREDSRSTVMLDEALGWNEAAFKGFVKLLAGKVKGLSDLLDVYRAYHADYLALTQKITATDALIDQIVYQLYGLTDDEIALVEATH